MNGWVLQSALRELRTSLNSPRVLVGMIGASLVLAMSGPFDTLSRFDLPGRLVYWLVIVVLSYLSSVMAARLTLGTLGQGMTRPLPRIVVATLASSIPSWLVVYGVTMIAAPDGLPPPLRLWFYCLVVAGVVVSMSVLMAGQQPDATRTASPPEPPPILERLPLPQRGRLLHLAVADHYVEVTTDRGRALLLLRLSDAIRETAPVPGLQVHRSHWVALDAVRKATRQSGRPVLELENGAIIPISRSYLEAARAAGLVT